MGKAKTWSREDREGAAKACVDPKWMKFVALNSEGKSLLLEFTTAPTAACSLTFVAPAPGLIGTLMTTQKCGNVCTTLPQRMFIGSVKPST